MDEDGGTRSPVVEIAADRARGASELARRCLEILAAAAADPAPDAGTLRRRLEDLAGALQAARPGMAPVRNLVADWLVALSREPAATPAAMAAAAAAAAAALADRSRRAVAQAAGHAAEEIGAGRTVMTHTLSATVHETFRRLAPGSTRAIVTESRPLLEGRRTAEATSDLGIPTTLVTDAQMAVFVGEADVVLVGADAVLPDGGVVNKVGTALLALAASDAGVPFLVVYESFKEVRPGAEAPEPEEMAADELGGGSPPGVRVRNVYFEVTPARLVDGWITERGVRRAPWPEAEDG